MIKARFNLRDIMIDLSPQDDPGYKKTSCGKPTCIDSPAGEGPTRESEKKSTCGKPTCNCEVASKKREDEEKRLEELTRSNLALLQQELRQALGREL